MDPDLIHLGMRSIHPLPVNNVAQNIFTIY
jgi:hypothetical protein